MTYPEALVVNGVEREVFTGYEDALAAIACINDTDLSDVERAYGVIEILYKEPIPDEDAGEAVHMAVKYLLQGKDPGEPRASSKVDMDYEHDMHYIRSSFRSDYGIDLNREPGLHWWEFMELLQGLSDGCILNRVRDVRNYDLNSIKDPKAKSRMIQAQRELALPNQLNKEDEETLDAFYAQFNQPE